MTASRRGDAYFQSLYAKEPDFQRLALHDADFRAMWDHEDPCLLQPPIDANIRAASARATSWTSPTRLPSSNLPNPC